MDKNKPKVYRLNGEIKPRFTGWMKEENQSLNFGGERKPRFTG